MTYKVTFGKYVDEQGRRIVAVSGTQEEMDLWNKVGAPKLAMMIQSQKTRRRNDY